MDRFDPRRQELAIAIAFLAGLVDACAFVSADRYFVSFMSGNTTRLAVDVVAAPRSALTPALLIMGFVVGVAGGRVVAVRARRWRKPALLGTVAVLLALAAPLRGGAALGAMVLAMGAVNNAFQRDGQAAVGLTYMTGALVRLGQGIGAALTGERQTGWRPYMLLWCALLAGAAGGAMLFTRLGDGTLWLAAVFAAGLAACSCFLVPREPQ